VIVNTAVEHARRKLMEMHDPDNVNAHFLLLPRDDVVATRTPLLPQNSPNGDIWWQLPEADRHAFRVVYFYTAYVAPGGDPTTQAVVIWLRWLAVRQAKSESLTWAKVTWAKAYEAASERLEGTMAHAGGRAMKEAYGVVQGILKARASTV
jgi:hypothetical protein